MANYNRMPLFDFANHKIIQRAWICVHKYCSLEKAFSIICRSFVSWNEKIMKMIVADTDALKLIWKKVEAFSTNDSFRCSCSFSSSFCIQHSYKLCVKQKERGKETAALISNSFWHSCEMLIILNRNHSPTIQWAQQDKKCSHMYGIDKNCDAKTSHILMLSHTFLFSSSFFCKHLAPLQCRKSCKGNNFTISYWFNVILYSMSTFVWLVSSISRQASLLTFNSIKKNIWFEWCAYQHHNVLILKFIFLQLIEVRVDFTAN